MPEQNEDFLRERTRFKSFEVDHVIGVDQFQAGWSLFGDTDYDAIAMWYTHDFDSVVLSTKDMLCEHDAWSLMDSCLYECFKSVHELMVKVEKRINLAAKDMVDVCMHVHFGQYPQLESRLPANFFLSSKDGLRLLYVDGTFKSIQVDKRFYLVEENGAYHAGHFKLGTWCWVHDMREFIKNSLPKEK